jgi:hypothetical protein
MSFRENAMKPILGLASWFLAGIALAQQPNSPGASMKINGADGPPFPIAVDLGTSLPATFSYSGGPNQPFATYVGTALQPGAATVFGDLVDLALSPARFHSWKKAASACPLDDQRSCPKSSPQRLTADEIRVIRDMVTS